MPAYPSIIRLDPMGQSKLYRFFDRSEYADEFCKGNVRISTLAACRATDDPVRRDQGEGSVTYKGGFSQGDGDDPAFVEIARRQGVSLPRESTGTMLFANIHQRTLVEAYVLCMTVRNDESAMSSFGSSCVEIFSPLAAFRRLTRVLHEVVAVRQSVIGLIRYRARSYTGLDPQPGPLGFVKPPDEYEREQEVRFLWTLHGDPAGLQPMMLACPTLSPFCRRVK
ncbi:MAG: hypothetical protein M3Y55_07470 [Pseudomonadota bacterium]|nr:hypothetical protein [Pseudomonadota bacterium]